jgi:hypothetical protein
LSGTGKTTYAKNYANIHNIRYIDFDLYFGLVYKGWTDKYGADKFFNMLPDNFITEYITPDTNKFLEYAKDKDVQVIIFECSNKEEHLVRLKAKNINLKSLSLCEEVITKIKKANIKVDYYDSRTV